MSEQSLYGNKIQPLRNVAAAVQLHTKLKNRQPGLPGMGVFYGFPGLGKTYAASHLAAHYDAIHVSVQRLWTATTLMESILDELSIVPQGTRARMMRQVNEGLSVAGRTLIVDEADYAVSKGMIEIIRDMHDGSAAPVILIGMENLPQSIKRYELVDGRIASWVRAEFADLTDAQLLANIYCPGVTLEDALLERIIKNCKGSARRISIDLSYVLEQSRLLGADTMSMDDWGDAPFHRGEAPAPRRGYQ